MLNKRRIFKTLIQMEREMTALFPNHEREGIHFGTLVSRVLQDYTGRFDSRREVEDIINSLIEEGSATRVSGETLLTIRPLHQGKINYQMSRFWHEYLWNHYGMGKILAVVATAAVVIGVIINLPELARLFKNFFGF